MLGHKRVPSREGGVEIVVEELAKRMVKLGNEVTVFNRRGHHVSGKKFDSQKVNNYKGILIQTVPTLNIKGLAALTSSFFAIISATIKKFDVIHIHAEGPAFFCWIPKILKKKVIVTIHGLDWQRAKWGCVASYVIRKGEKNAVKYADEIIVLSRNVQKYFKEVYGRKTKFIPNGVTKPVIKENKEIFDRWGLKKDEYVLFLGRIVPEKGVEYLIKAWKNIKTSKKLVIAGGSSDTDEFVGKLKEKSDDTIIYTGFIQGRQLEELYSNAYLYVLPSDVEGMPLSLLEAMSYGNCCLVSSIPECTEVVEDKAVIFKKSSVKDLEEKIQMLIDNPKIVKQHKATASAFICKKYNWEKIVKKTLSLYEVK